MPGLHTDVVVDDEMAMLTAEELDTSVGRMRDACAGVSIFARAREARAHSSATLRRHAARGELGGPVHAVALQHNALGPAPAADVAEWLADHRFHALTSVAVGAFVVFSDAVSVAAGAVAGETGMVVGVTLASQPPQGAAALADCAGPWVAALTVRLDANERDVRVVRSKIALTHRDGRTITKRTFPLRLAYGMTAHQAQGRTPFRANGP
jgi:hypothetical protein